MSRNLGALRRLAVGALAGLRRRRSNSGYHPVSSCGSASTRGLRAPPRYREISVAPRMHRATMPFLHFGLWRGSVIRNGGGPMGRRLRFSRSTILQYNFLSENLDRVPVARVLPKKRCIWPEQDRHGLDQEVGNASWLRC